MAVSTTVRQTRFGDVDLKRRRRTAKEVLQEREVKALAEAPRQTAIALTGSVAIGLPDPVADPRLEVMRLLAMASYWAARSHTVAKRMAANAESDDDELRISLLAMRGADSLIKAYALAANAGFIDPGDDAAAANLTIEISGVE